MKEDKIEGISSITGNRDEARSKRVIIQKEVMEKLGWKKGDKLHYEVRGNKLILSKEE